MKINDKDLAEQIPDVTKHTQEDAASRDFVEQREKGVSETEAKAKKQKKPDK